jgi:magnesium-transporting ATPase (P-type)
MIEASLCFSEFLAVFLAAGYLGRIGLSFFEPLASISGWRLSGSFAQITLLATTVYFAGVVTSQVGNALACRSDRARGSSLGWLSNPYLWAGILLEIAGILAIIYIPFLAGIFRVVPLPGWMWIVLGLNALVLYSMEWIRKAIVRKMRSASSGKAASLAIQEVNR